VIREYLGSDVLGYSRPKLGTLQFNQ